ncbi:DUF418 domain-containing protein [Amycolatopsis suaedae]|uniref:DUF418 domain-containing protein n=2 Tax=Amycolatopsis suaedae TaxID=2510978 RepID=A0A4Q7JA47_9PSEU|nr:DUF418 domain-containing protein [Amycolatopsis suaedae]
MIMTGERVRDVDAVRGFALLGIFVVNITFMASGYPSNIVTDPAYSSTLDEIVRGLTSALFGMKFYLLFSFLFGYSFTLQIESARRAGTAFGPRMLRRIAGLFALGVLNIVLIYGGDILTTYAVACLILFLLRGVRDRTALWIAGAVYGYVLLSMTISSLVMDPAAFLPPESEALANAERITEAMRGGFADVLDTHLSGLSLLVIQALSMQGPTALAMFLVGMVAGRRRLLSRVRGDEPVLRTLQWIGFPVGLAGALIYTLAGGNGNTLAVVASVATAPLLTAAYVATLLRVLHNPRTARVRDVLAPTGRIALTNYLLQGVFGLLIFTGVGLGLAGSLSPLETMLLAVALFAVQLIASAWWLRRFQYGPAEWLLRWVTNGSRPVWRKITSGG